MSSAALDVVGWISSAGALINIVAPMLVPVAASLVRTGRPVAAISIETNSAFHANGPSTIVGPVAPISCKQVSVISAR